MTNREISIEEMHELVRDAIDRVADARRAMTQETVPPTPLPRQKYFRLRGSGWYVEYPPEDERGRPMVECLRVHRGHARETINLYGRFPLNRFVELVGCAPTNIVRLVRWLESIERWMRARAAGRQRHAQEILRQQQRSSEEIERMLTALKLRRST